MSRVSQNSVTNPNYICCTNQLYICGVLFAITFATTLLQRVVALTKIWWGEWRLFLAMFHPDLWRCGPSNAIWHRSDWHGLSRCCLPHEHGGMGKQCGIPEKWAGACCIQHANVSDSWVLDVRKPRLLYVTWGWRRGNTGCIMWKNPCDLSQNASELWQHTCELFAAKHKDVVD